MMEDNEEDNDETLILRLDSINGTALAAEEMLSSTSTLKEFGDWDGDNFIDICSPAQLTKINDVPEGRYELSGDLDFFNHGTFIPIEQFNGTLDGNGYSLLNLSLGKARTPSASGEASGVIAAFGNERDNAEIRNLGIVGVQASHSSQNGTPAGALIGEAFGGLVRNCFVQGTSDLKTISGRPAGGLIGNIVGQDPNVRIENCYVRDVSVENGAMGRVAILGGLLGNISIKGGSAFKYCYTVTDVAGERDLDRTGGLIGNVSQRISRPMESVLTHSYWDSADKENAIGNMDQAETVQGLTLEELRCPTGADNTGCKNGTTIYETWSGEHWDFGSNMQFPILKTTRGDIMRNQARAMPSPSEPSNNN